MNNVINKDIDLILENIDDIFDALNNKNILFAGGGGFLGYYFTNLFYKLANQKKINFKLYLIDNFVSSSNNFAFKKDLNKNIHFLNLDICQSNNLNFDDKFDYIIHAAGIASPYYYRKKPIETLEVSIQGSKNLLELARSHQAKYTFFSSSEIYGDPLSQFIPIQESYRGNVSTMGPRSCYDEGKRLGETLCYIYHNYYNLHTNIIRPFNIYGPGMTKNDYRVMANFANNILNNKPLNVYGRGKQTRTFCYITDGIEGFLRVIFQGKKGEVYNIGNQNPEISMLDLAELFFKVLDKPSNINKVSYPTSYPEDEPQRRCPDISKARDHLNFFAKVKLEDGISNYIEWCKDNF